MTLHEGARNLVASGYTVLPLEPGSNLPHRLMLGRGWRFCTCGVVVDQTLPLVGSTDLAWLDYWWARDSRANVGVVTGARSRLLVLDVDTHHGDGHAEFEAWRAARQLEGVALPDHPTYVTSSGGRHHWFALEPDVHVRTNTMWLRNAEVKACGGQVAAPPSLRDVDIATIGLDDQPVWSTEAVEYRWERTCSLPYAPEWLLLDVATRREKRGSGGGSVAQGGTLEATGELERRGLAVGSRDEDCYRLACRLWRRSGHDERMVWAVVRRVWEATPQPGDREPFTWERAQLKVRAARRFVEAVKAQEETEEDVIWEAGGVR